MGISGSDWSKMVCWDGGGGADGGVDWSMLGQGTIRWSGVCCLAGGGGGLS